MSLDRAPSLLEKPMRSSESSSAGTQTRAKKVDWVVLGVEVVYTLAVTTISGYLLMQLTRRFSNMITDDNEKARSQGSVAARLQKILQKRSKVPIKIPTLSHYELIMADEVLDPDDIEVSFSDIGGLDDMKQEIYQLAVLPLVKPELFDGKLVQPTKGILLYGKPGTGKTMMAKAIAKEAHAIFLPLQLSKILSKWVGESNKLVAATFSLARKLQPAILFIDELDTFLKASSSETAHLDAIKAEFLTLWDGIGTSSSNRMMVLGATNKPHLIDSAILRRLPRTFPVPLPDKMGRQAILKLLLKDEPLSEEAELYVPTLAKETIGYSGSDLKELCQAGAMVRVQEVTAEMSRRRVMGEATQEEEASTEAPDTLRAISLEDLKLGLRKVQRTGAAAASYGRQERADAAGNMPNLQNVDLASLLQSLARAASPSSTQPNNRSNDDDPIPTL